MLEYFFKEYLDIYIKTSYNKYIKSKGVNLMGLNKIDSFIDKDP